MTRLATNVMALDAAAEADFITGTIRTHIAKTLRRRGAVVAVSGGIDSAVTAALCARAVGPDRVLAVMMPERDSSPDTVELSRLTIEHIRARSVERDITAILESVGCYARRDEAYRMVLPEYGDGWHAKILLPSASQTSAMQRAEVIALSPDGREVRRPLPVQAYLQVVAATNFKQRVRKMLEYYYADLENYAVIGTANRLEYDQGFFVKVGDGAADMKPIAHLYKTQVYQLAEYLGLPTAVREREPTTDTYSLPQSQAEFFFDIPIEQFDVCLYGANQRLDGATISSLAGLEIDVVEAVLASIERKRRTTQYLQTRPILAREVPEIAVDPAGGGTGET